MRAQTRGTDRRGTRRLAYGISATILLLSGAGNPAFAASAPDPGSAGATSTCKKPPSAGAPEQSDNPWWQQRLDLDRVHTITKGAGVLVAVIDSGLDRASPQIQAMSSRIIAGVNVIDPSTPQDVADCVGHGTRVTALIAASKVGRSAFSGVAPAARIMPIKQSKTLADGDADGIAMGIDQAIQQGAKVINISLTAENPGEQLEPAVTRAEAAGALIVAAAGNKRGDGNPAEYPAAYSTTHTNVVAVAATDSSNNVGAFSETGPYVTIAAPGVDIEAPTAVSGYVIDSGTSYATPLVSGTAALVFAAVPGVTPAQVRERLIATADPPPRTTPDTEYGYGIVNPFLAVTAVRSSTAGASVLGNHSPIPVKVPHASNGDDRNKRAVAIGISALALAVVAGLAGAISRQTRQPSAAAPSDPR